jgi:hypothetical protein
MLGYGCDGLGLGFLHRLADRRSVQALVDEGL